MHTAIFLAALSSAGSLAAESPARFLALTLHNPSEIDSWKLTCYADDDELRVYDCNVFTFGLLEVNAGSAQAAPAGGGEPDAARKATQQMFAGLKQECASAPPAAKSSPVPLHRGKQELVEQLARERSERCSCKDADCLGKVLRRQARKTPVCTIVSNSNHLRFKRQGPDKWVSQVGPAGICDAVTISTLEFSGADGWAFFERTAYTKGVKPGDKFCTQDTEPKPLRVYSDASYPRDAKVNCGIIDPM